MAFYYNQLPAQFLKGDKVQFQPGSYYITLPAGKYTITAAGGRGGAISQKGYSGGGGYVQTQDIVIKSALSCSVSVGHTGVDGGVEQTITNSGSVMWQYVDYVTSWYDPATGRYKIPLGSSGMKETVYPAGNGTSSGVYVGGYSIVGAGGNGAQANKSGTGGSNHGVGYVTIVAMNSPPTTPQNVKLEQPYAGRAVSMSCNASTDSDGDKITYVWEGRTDSNAFVTIGTTNALTHTVTAPKTGVAYQVRVKAVDSNGAESTFGTSTPRNIIHNYPPTISGSDSDYGKKRDSFAYSFSVDDEDAADSINVEMLLDNVSIGTINQAIRKRVYTIDLADRWVYLLNSSHVLKIRATDTAGSSAERIINFERVIDGLDVVLSEPIKTRSGAKIRTIQALFFYEAPESSVEIYITNNAKAKNPTWHRYDQYERGHIFEFPDLAEDGDEGLLARVKIIKPNGYTKRVTFSGATFMVNANGNESEKWADNILFSNAFSGKLAGITNIGDMARSIDEGSLGSGTTNAMNSTANGEYIRIGDLQICMICFPETSDKRWPETVFATAYPYQTTKTETEIVSSKGFTMVCWTYPAKFTQTPVVFQQPFQLYDEDEGERSYGVNIIAMGRWR